MSVPPFHTRSCLPPHRWRCRSDARKRTWSDRREAEVEGEVRRMRKRRVVTKKLQAPYQVDPGETRGQACWIRDTPLKGATTRRTRISEKQLLRLSACVQVR